MSVHKLPPNIYSALVLKDFKQLILTKLSSRLTIEKSQNLKLIMKGLCVDTSTSIKVQQGLKPIKKGFIRYEGSEGHDIKPQFRVVGAEPLKKMNPKDRIVEWVELEEVKNLLDAAEKVFKMLSNESYIADDHAYNNLRMRLSQWKEFLIKG